MTVILDNEIIAAVLTQHERVHSAARGVERCGCGQSAVGEPGWHRRHLSSHIVLTVAPILRTALGIPERTQFDDDPPGINVEDSGAKPSVADASDRVFAFLSWYGDGRIVPEIALGWENGEVPLYARDIEALRQAAVRGEQR